MVFVLYALLAIVVAGVLFLIAARFLPAGEQIAPPLRDEPPWDLPVERELRPDDVDSVRLPVALRGYRFAETDLLLDRLAAELRDRDAEIARLRGWTPADASDDYQPDSYEPGQDGPNSDEPDGDAADSDEPGGEEPLAEGVIAESPDEAGSAESDPAATGTDEHERG